MADWPVLLPEERCRQCGIDQTTPMAILHGSGNPDSPLAMVGEAPGADEEERGDNFVGRAGNMLTQCISEAGLAREDIWICNSVRHRPTLVLPGGDRKNRTPTQEEIMCCNGFLEEELKRIRPKAILCLGGVAAMAVLQNPPPGGVQENLGKVIWSEKYQAWVILSYHPSYLLRRQAERSMLTFNIVKAWRYATGQIGEPAPVDYRVIESVDEAIALRDYILRNAEELAMDWETNGVHLTKSIGFCLALSIKEREAFVIPRYKSGMIPRWTHQELRTIDQEVIVPLLISDIPKIGSNIAFDISVSQTTVGTTPRNVAFDDYIAHHTINNHLGWKAHGLKIMADLYTDMGRYDDELDQWMIANGLTDEGKPDMARLYLAPDWLVHKYACADADATVRVKHVLEPWLRRENLWGIFVNERLPLALEYQENDRIGVRVNVPYARQLSGDLQDTLEHTAAELSEIAGREINPNSYPQVRQLLYEDLGIPVTARTDTGLPSTREEHILPYRDLHQAVATLLQHRAYTKLKGYVDGTRGNRGILAVVDEDEYARMNTIIPATETFRLATRKPFPIHTWPKTDPPKPSVRRLIIPDEGHVILSADYKQQEWCIQAIAAAQWDMVEALLEQGEDVHEIVMRDLGGITKSQFQNIDGLWISDAAHLRYKAVRSKFKSINFMILYRGGAAKLARSIGESEETAAQYIADYYERYDRIHWWQYEKIKELREHGRVWGLFGTYRVLPGIYDTSKWSRMEAERQACNFPIQEGGAHVMYRAYLALKRDLRGDLPLRAPFPGRVLFTMHDSIVGQVRRDLVDEGKERFALAMGQPYPELAGRSLRIDLETGDWWE